MSELMDTQYLPVVAESEATRATFLRRTYGHVALAVLGFILVEFLFFQSPAILNIGLSMTQGWTWLMVIGGFMFATNALEGWTMRSTNRTHHYIALLLYVILEAFIFIPLIYMAMAISGDYALLRQAAVLTLALFTGLSAIALTTKHDFSYLRNILMVGGFIAIGLIVAGMLFGFTLGLWFSVAMVALAAGSILYQTNSIMNNFHKTQYVAASLGLFAALMLLFWYILSILSRSSGD